MIPKIGDFVVGDKQPYEYLVESIDKFINQELALIEAKHIGLTRDPYINIKINKRKQEQMIRFGFECLLLFLFHGQCHHH